MRPTRITSLPSRRSLRADQERAARRAGELGLAWGLGHAATLFAFGLPVLVFDRFLPQRVQQAAETAIGFVIVYLALRLLVRWRRGAPLPRAPACARRADAARSLRGRAHARSGGAGVGVLVLASVSSTGLAVILLVLLAAFTAVSMSLLSSGFGSMLVSRPARAVVGGVAPALGGASLAFGVWYATAAWSLAPYPF